MFITEKANGEPPISKAKLALQAAHARLSTPHVWVQHTPQSDRQDCLETAIARQFGWKRGTPWHGTERARDFANQAVMRAVKQRTANVPFDRLANWNDQRGRTLAEVLAVLTEAMLLVDLVEAEFQLEPPVFVANAAVFYGELPGPGPFELQIITGAKVLSLSGELAY